MRKIKVAVLAVISTIALFTQSLTAFAGFDLQHYDMTDDGLWLIQSKGASGNSEEGLVTIHFLVDSSNRDIAYINNYYCANYYDENGDFQESAIHYYPEDMTVETTINGYEVWTNDYGYPVGDWYFAGFSSGYGSLPGTYTLTTDFEYTTVSNSKLTPFTVTKDGTVHIFGIQGDQDFIDENLDDFISWAKERQSELDAERSIINGEESVSVKEEELQTAESTEIAPEKTPEVTLSPTVETNVMPTETKISKEAATTEETANRNVKATVFGGVILFAVVGGIVFCLRKKR